MTTCDRIASEARACVEKATANKTGSDLFEALAQLHRENASRFSAEGFDDLVLAETVIATDFEERAERLRTREPT